jgi:hypothetical protein
MLYYLPHYYPPASPTHQLVYIPPTTAYSHSSTSLSTPPHSPASSNASRHGRHHAPLPRRSHHPTTIVTAPAAPWPLMHQQLAPRSDPRLPPTPTSSSSHPGMPHHVRRPPPPTTHHSAPQLPIVNTPPRAALFEPSPYSSPTTSIPANIISTADLLSRTKIRSCHLATDHDCVLRKYEMTMRQQPVQARMCGVGEKCKSPNPNLILGRVPPFPSSTPLHTRNLKVMAAVPALVWS